MSSLVGLCQVLKGVAGSDGMEVVTIPKKVGKEECRPIQNGLDLHLYCGGENISSTDDAMEDKSMDDTMDTIMMYLNSMLYGTMDQMLTNGLNG